MKWLAAVSFGLALVVRLAWHSNIALVFPVTPTMGRGFALSSILFWLLLMAGVSFLWAALVMRKR
jgi:hypothetical protein